MTLMTRSKNTQLSVIANKHSINKCISLILNKLPEALLCNIFCYYLDLKEVSRLDSAMTNKTNRHYFLFCLSICKFNNNRTPRNRRLIQNIRIDNIALILLMTLSPYTILGSFNGPYVVASLSIF